MTTFTDDLATSFKTLAASTAFRLGREAIVSVELREALNTVQLDEGAVRIGDWDILARETEEGRVYDVRSKHSGQVMLHQIVYYDTARHFVHRLNNGESINAADIKRTMRYNDEYRRVRVDIQEFSDRADEYTERGNHGRAILMENRLSAARGRADVLRGRLLDKSSYR